MKIVTYHQILEFKTMYEVEKLDLATIAFKTKFTPETIRFYLELKDDKKKITYFNPLPDFDSTLFRFANWKELCRLTKEENKNIKELWKELDA